jgi:pyruvate dehydrogenase (quinone)
LYDAKCDHQPVLAIVGQQPRAALGSSYQQEVDLTNLFKDVASEYSQMIVTPQQVRHVIDRALRIAIARRTVTCVIVPNDVQDLSYKKPARDHGTAHSSPGYTPPRVGPSAEELTHAADVLNAGQRVAILIGAGALDAGVEVIEVAELLGAGIAKALLGKAAVADNLPYVTGGIGLLGTKATDEMMKGCDTLLMVGSGFPYSEFLPKEGQARGVQIDIEPSMLGIRYPMDAHLVGDSATTLRELIPLLKAKSDRSWRSKIVKDVQEWWQTLESRATGDAKPLNPQRVFWELSPRLPDLAMLACDTGSAVFWYSRDLKMRPGMLTAHSGTLASMGAAMPYAIAAKFAHPERVAIAIVGDGAMQMNGLGELITVSKYWRRWSDPRFVVLVLNNQDLNMVTWEQRVLEGDPKFEASQNLPDFPYAEYAKLLGFNGIRVSQQEHVASAWDLALAADRPTVIEAITDPNVPFLPPHVTLKQAKAYATALAKGDPDALGVIKSSLREILS